MDKQQQQQQQTTTPANQVTTATTATNLDNNCPGECVVSTSTPGAQNLVTIPVPFIENQGIFAYVTVKSSLHDRSSQVFGLNQAEVLALSKRYDSLKEVVNGFSVPVPPTDMLNVLAQLGYRVICCSGETEICWTMQREIL